MFYELEIADHIRVPPKAFSEDINEAVLRALNEHFDGYISQELGFIIGIISIDDIGEGIIIPGLFFFRCPAHSLVLLKNFFKFYHMILPKGGLAVNLSWQIYLSRIFMGVKMFLW